MPLTINTNNCTDGDALWVWREEDKAAWQPEGYYLEAKAQTLGFALGILAVGGTVTESNAGEVFARLRLYEAHHGALCRERDPETGEWVDAPFTRADVDRLVGLSTNWGSKRESRRVWLARVLDDEASV